MLAQDKLILATYKDNLATESEIDQLDFLVKKHVPDEDFRQVVISGDTRATLARFLWQTKQVHKTDNVPARGLEILQKCISIRKEHGMNDLLRPNDPVFRAFIREYRDAVPYSFHSTTNEGYPVKFAKWGACDLEFLEKAWKETPDLVIKAELRLWEYMTQVHMPMESQRQGKIVDRAVLAYDLTMLGMRHISLLKTVLGKVSMIFRQVFPETIARTMVYHTAWWISTPLNMVKLFLHPMARGKIIIDTAEPVRLREIVPNEDFPSFAGGACQCKHCTSKPGMDGGLELDFANDEDVRKHCQSDVTTTPSSTASSPSNATVWPSLSSDRKPASTILPSWDSNFEQECNALVNSSRISVNSPRSFVIKSLILPATPTTAAAMWSGSPHAMSPMKCIGEVLCADDRAQSIRKARATL